MVTRHTQSCVDEDGPEGGDVELCTISQSLSMPAYSVLSLKKNSSAKL